MTKKKKEKQPFWKKGPPELQHLATHIGHIIDNSNAGQLADLAMIGAFAALGYKAWGVYGIPTGPLAYKLACTMGGTPPVSQITGLLMLLEMGIQIADWNNIAKYFDIATQSTAGEQVTGAKPNPLVYGLGSLPFSP